MRRSIIVVATALMFINVEYSVAEGLYRWVDKDGKTHYSETRPADASVTEVKVDNPPASKSGPDNAPSASDDDYRKCPDMKCLGEKMERDRLQREAGYARARGDNEPKAKKSPSVYDNPNLDNHLRERCHDMGADMKGVNCNDTNKLRELWGFPKKE